MAGMSFVERLAAKMEKIGLHRRKALELAKGVAPTAARAKTGDGITEKLITRLMNLGQSERKATETAKALAPLVRAAIKQKGEKALDLKQQARKKARKAKKVALKTTDKVKLTAEEKAAAEAGVDAQIETETLDEAVAPLVNGHRLRIDLPVLPMTGAKVEGDRKGYDLLRVMHGLSTFATYLVAAVKGAEGIIAVRQLSSNNFNVKFYPDMAYWEKTPEQLRDLGAHDHLKREWYERMHFNQNGLDQLLARVAAEAKPKSRIKALVDRLRGLSFEPLKKAFAILYSEKGRKATKEHVAA